MTVRREPGEAPPDYLTVREAAERLRLNEKKIYELIKEGVIPATKAAGKWLFPRHLVDEWMLESTHGGALADRLIVTGSDDPLLTSAIASVAAQIIPDALLVYTPTGTRAGLDLLARRRASACAIHWGPAELADRLHPQMLTAYPGHREWTLVRLGSRRQGIMLGPRHAKAVGLSDVVKAGTRWTLRQQGSGTQHFLENRLLGDGLQILPAQVAGTALTEREAASTVARGLADCAPGVLSAATEFGLGFLPLGWECFDLVLPKKVYFLQLFQRLLAELRGLKMQGVATALAGYDLSALGKVLSLPAE